jgi:hypothetical protein
MKKINLYGHLIVDRIFNGVKYSESLGGIANVWESLSKIDTSLSIRVNPCSFGEAILLVNTETNERIGKAILNKRTFRITNYPTADWHHIAYINQIVDTSFIKEINSGIISADITKENPEKCIENLQYLDFLFISKEDLFDNISNIAKKTKGWVISHDPSGSTYSDGNEVFEYKIPLDYILSNVNVLGAGDMFASSFISEYLKTKNISKSIENSHKRTTNLLKMR